tara:strand:+ start:981 stop:1412 length:432 start_codon:yes stop_codon:yes gene_type:complete
MVSNKSKNKQIKRKIPKKYTASLSREDKSKQKKNLIRSRKMYKKGIYVDRPQLKSYPKKRSAHIVKFEKRYNRKITDKNFIDKNILSKKGQNQILKKGRGAYYSSGSRPNQSSSSWAYARLASVIMGGKARKVDNKIWLSEKR